MSVAELFESGVHKHNKGHYRNLLMLARADGKISEEEDKYLREIGVRIGLSVEQIEDIKANPMQYPTHPPFGKEERIVRYINFIEVIKSDDDIDEREVKLLKKFGIAIGFSSEDVDKYFNEINRLLDENHSEDEILAQLY
jgi:uncharacterized tellurite resistance protein B-like protein